MDELIFGLGCKKLPKKLVDKRDYKFKDYHKFGVEVPLPNSVDLRGFNPYIHDQGLRQSCTGHGVSGAVEMLYCMRDSDMLELFKKETDNRLSADYLYFRARVLRGWEKEDEGAYIFDVIKVFSDFGVPQDKFYKSGIVSIYQEPSFWCDTMAKFWTKNISYYKIRDCKYENNSGIVVDMRKAIFLKQIVVGGLSVFSSFFSSKAKTTGFIDMPLVNEKSLGGHCVSFIGYFDDKQVFVVKNSWGEDISDKGFLYVPYEYVRKYCSDVWSLKLK